MTSNRLLPVAAGVVVLVGLALAAGYVGATLAPAPAPQPAATAPSHATLRAQLDEFDRRLAGLAETVRQLGDSTPAALEDLQALRGEIAALQRRIAALESGTASGAGAEVGTSTTPAKDGVENVAATPLPPTGPERDRFEAAQREKFRKEAREMFEKFARQRIPSELRLLTDATPDGAAHRLSQVVAGARGLAVQYQLGPAQEKKVRALLSEQMEASVRDIGPYLKAGLEKTDYSQVKPIFERLWADTDAGMRDVLDEEQFEAYADEMKERRAVRTRLFDEYDRKRLSR